MSDHAIRHSPRLADGHGHFFGHGHVIGHAAGIGGLSCGSSRAALSRVLGVAGVLCYNWWLLVLLRPGLMRSPNELFSNMEVTGQPYASVMQHADVLSGLLILAAFAVAGSRSLLAGRGEWLAIMVYAAAGAAGGIFPETCADSISTSCKNMELGLQLPLSQYLHIVTGVTEFAAITIAVLLAAKRTSADRTACALVYRVLAKGAFAGYPLLGAAYLFDRFGAIMEAVFFVSFAAIVIAELFERTRAPAAAS